MSKLLKVALSAALGFAVSTSLYAADTHNRSTAWSDGEVRAAMDKCNNLTGTPRAKCIVNIRPTAGGDRTTMNPDSKAEDNTVKDGTARAEEEYSAALKQCEAANPSDKDRCINVAKERFGRM